jgi:hypothetical protein
MTAERNAQVLVCSCGSFFNSSAVCFTNGFDSKGFRDWLQLVDVKEINL